MRELPDRLNTVTFLFDMDGTLIDTDMANSWSYREAIAQVGLGEMPVCSGRITKAAIRKKWPWLGEAEMKCIAAVKADRYAANLGRSSLGPAMAALAMIRSAERRYGKIVLLTDSNERRAVETLRHHGLIGWFDEVVCNAGNGDKYANYFKSHDADPANCIVFENEEEKVYLAIGAGVKTENVRKVG